MVLEHSAEYPVSEVDTVHQQPFPGSSGAAQRWTGSGDWSPDLRGVVLRPWDSESRTAAGYSQSPLINSRYLRT